MTFGERILSFYDSIEIKEQLPEGVVVLNPFKGHASKDLYIKFYNRFYNDIKPRHIILGINPGRWGGGITGVPFTDPLKLEKYCNIPNDLKKKSELSADFIYAMIDQFGGPEKFYKHFYISAVSPLGFTRDNKNLNYYDIKELQTVLNDFIMESLKHQLEFGIHRDNCFCLGEGTNYQFLSKLNKQHQFFRNITPLPHPRFIMQYRRKHMKEYVQMYLDKLNAVI